MGWTAIELPGADVRLDAEWMPRVEADALLAALVAGLPWTVHRIRMFGRLVDSPRLSCWIGDPGAGYAYSGTRFEPHPWPALLMPVRERVSAACGEAFNSVLANLYRDGRDAMGWHRDDERELGAEPVIASLSLGATRRFRFKPAKPGAHARRPATARNVVPGGEQPGAVGHPLGLDLSAGSLLRMAGPTQHTYAHSLPATRRPVAARLNLTFRRINGAS